MEDIYTLDESAGAPVKKGKRWLVTVARPGKGSKGTYSEEMLKSTGPVAIPAGTKAFFKHAATEDRDPRDQVGTYDEGAFWNDEEGELQAYLLPFPRYAQVLEEAGSNIEASVHVAARKRKGTDEVTEFVFRRDNTVDLVAFAGLEGSGLKYQVETLFAAAAADSEIHEEENNMAFELTQELWESFTTRVTAAIDAKFDTFVAESKLELQGVADADAVASEVKVQVAEALAGIAEVEKSIDDATLPVKVKESLKERARLGEDIATDLAGAVEIAAETLKEIKPAPYTPKRGSVVVVDESLDSSKPTFKLGRWSK